MNLNHFDASLTFHPHSIVAEIFISEKVETTPQSHCAPSGWKQAVVIITVIDWLWLWLPQTRYVFLFSIFYCTIITPEQTTADCHWQHIIADIQLSIVYDYFFSLYWSKPRCHVMLLQLDNVQYFKQFSLRVIMWDYPAPGWRMIVMMILIFSLKQYAVETVKWYMDVYFDIYIYIYSENRLMFYIIHQTKTTNIWFPGSQKWLFVYVIIIYIWCFGLWVSQNKQFENTVFDLEMD